MKRENAIVNRLNKTKVERVVDHEAERIERVKRENAVKRAAAASKVYTYLSSVKPPLRDTRDGLLDPKSPIFTEKSGPRARRGTQGREGRSFIRFLPECASRR